MTYSILSAAYANAEHTAAVCNTAEAGSVLASEHDTPQLWQAMLSAVQVQPYVQPDTRPAVMADYRARLDVYISRLAGIALFTDDPAVKDAAKVFRASLIGIPDHPTVLAAPDGPTMQSTMLSLYVAAKTAAVAAAPAGKTEFDRISK